MKKILVPLVLLIFLPALAYATDWYARPYRPGGYGASDGTSYATAFNGIDSVKSINWNSIQPGDTLYICGFHDGGNYDYSTFYPRPWLWQPKAGTPSSPITIRGDCPGDPGTIFGSGMHFTDGWALHDSQNNIYSRAFAPLPNNYVNLNQAFERHKSADQVKGIIRLNRPGNTNFASWQPSSYYLDTNNTLYYKPASGSANDYIFYTSVDSANINANSYNIIKNLNLMSSNNPSFGCSIGIRDYVHHVTVDNVSIRWAGANAAIGIGPNNTYITIQNSRIKDAISGIYFANHVKHIVVRNNEIYDLNQDGYYYKSLKSRGDCHGIALQGGGDDMIIENNHIYNSGGEGIVWYYDARLTTSMTNVIIRYNHIHHVIDLADPAVWLHNNQRGIEFGGDLINNLTIYDNYIYGNIIHDIGNPVDDNLQNNQFGTGIRLKSPYNVNKVVSWYVYNNIIYNANLGLWGFNPYPGFAFKNNIIMNSRTYHTYFLSITNLSVIDMSNNIYYPDGANKFFLNGQTGNFQTWQSLVQDDANSRVINPLFVSPVSNFHLQSGSPAIDAGTNVGLTRDYEGNAVPQGSAPDIGAFESAGSAPSVCAAADINCDTKVDVSDLVLLAIDFGKISGYNTKCDIKKDDIIDIFDVVYVASKFT